MSTGVARNWMKVKIIRTQENLLRNETVQLFCYDICSQLQVRYAIVLATSFCMATNPGSASGHSHKILA
jgi:hypothetical protein